MSSAAKTMADGPASAPDGRPLRILLITAHPHAVGPMPKLAPMLAKGFREAGAQVIELGWSTRSTGPEGYVRKAVDRSLDLARILSCVRRCRPDVLYVSTSHDWKTLVRDIPLALALGRGGPPFVLHIHGSACERFGRPGQRLFTWCSIWLARRAAAVMLLSSEELEPWRSRCPTGRFVVVLNPFEPSRGEPGAGADAAGRPANGVPIVLFVGRLMRDKGVFDLVSAMSIVSRILPCRLVMAGSGPAREVLVEQIADEGLEDTVTLAGYLDGPRLDRAYASADVFVLPSYREGFPLSVMEAMGHGLPVITTPIRGCAEFLDPGENALFVPPGDAQRLAEAIRTLLTDDELRARMGGANRLRVAAFAPDRVVPKYLEVLRSAAHARVRS